MGIDIDIDANTISIAQGKIDAIYSECVMVSSKNRLSRKTFQTLTGKLLYIHKCVRPTRTFVNRVLALLRNNPKKEYIHLTQDFFKDIQWFVNFLPRFNGLSFIDKEYIENSETLCIDASLTGVGGVWGNRVYASPIIGIPGFELKIVHLEIINVLIAIRVWANLWQHKNITFRCDCSTSGPIREN